eukprot:1280827-Amphidinium_carterae.1
MMRQKACACCPFGQCDFSHPSGRSLRSLLELDSAEHMLCMSQLRSERSSLTHGAHSIVCQLCQWVGVTWRGPFVHTRLFICVEINAHVFPDHRGRRFMGTLLAGLALSLM